MRIRKVISICSDSFNSLLGLLQSELSIEISDLIFNLTSEVTVKSPLRSIKKTSTDLFGHIWVLLLALAKQLRYFFFHLNTYARLYNRAFWEYFCG